MKTIEDLYDEIITKAGGKPDGTFSYNGYIWNFKYLKEE